MSQTQTSKNNSIKFLETAEVPELPPSWCWTYLKDISHRITDGTHQPPQFVESGIPFLFVRHIVHGEISFENTKFISQETYDRLNARCPVEVGDILYSAVGSYGVAVPVRINTPLSFQRHIAHIKPTEQMSQSFLVHALNSPVGLAQSHRVARGVAQKTVTLGDLSYFAIPVAPLNEQHRIVAEIETQFTRLDAVVTAFKRVQANLKRYRASVLQAACTGRLAPTEAELAHAEGRAYESADQLLQRILQERRAKWEAEQLADMKTASKAPKDDRWKSKYREPVKPDTSELPELPEGWVYATVDQIADSLDHLRVPVNEKDRQKRQGDVPYYGANGLVGYIDNYIFDESLVLVVEDETFIGRQKPFSYKITGRSWVNNHAHILRATFATTTDFLNYAMMFYNFIPMTTGTTGRRKLTKKALMGAALKLPPVVEQCRIVAEVERRLSVIDALEAVIVTNLKRADRLRQAILKRAFEGKLVPQDPTDEPASMLLERILMERERTTEKPKATPRQANAPQSTVQPKVTTPVQGELALGLRE